MKTLNDSDYAKLKAIHASARDALRAAHKNGGEEHRYAILASAFVRGRKYRGHERLHHVTTNMDGSKCEHHLPDRTKLYQAIVTNFAIDARPTMRADRLAIEVEIAAWLADPSGAIAAPVRVKAVYQGLGAAPVAGDLLPMAAE